MSESILPLLVVGMSGPVLGTVPVPQNQKKKKKTEISKFF